MFYFILLALFLSGCSDKNDTPEDLLRKQNQVGEYIYRYHDDFLFGAGEFKEKPPELYPWEQKNSSAHPFITKDYFRCKGSTLNPPVIVQNNGKEAQRYYDCGGAEKHSLPLRDNKEFIYPVLVDLMNYIQEKSGKKVVITCGHRCPDHNSYADSSGENSSSKHMVGAEVDFYVQGLEGQPEKVINYIFEYYKTTPKYKGLKDYEEFTRYDKGDSNIRTAPWMNKEVFVKLFTKGEGRDFDNRHLYPYISVQVRFDGDLQEKVIFSGEKAYRNYLRY
jgi:hypothetical protein